MRRENRGPENGLAVGTLDDPDTGSRLMNGAAARERLETALETYRRSFFLVEMLGLDIGYGEDICITRFPVDDFLFNPQESYHGGLLVTVMDVTMAHLSKHLTGAAGATMELKAQFLRPLTRGPARCEARFLRRGRSIGFLEARIWDGDDKPVAIATATWKMADGSPEDRSAKPKPRSTNP